MGRTTRTDSEAASAWLIGSAVAVLLLAAGCLGTSRFDTAYAGRTVAYEAGVPNFDLEAVPTIRSGAPGVDFYLGLPRMSLVFVQRGEHYEAIVERMVRLVDGRSRRVVAQESATDTFLVSGYEETRLYESFLVRTRLEAPPGAYRAEVSVEDLGSGSEARRRQDVQVPRPGGEPYLSPIRFETRRGAENPPAPAVSLHLPAGAEALHAVVELAEIPEDGAVDVSLRLLALRSDTAVATPPFWLSSTRGSLAYRVSDLRVQDTVRVMHRRASDVEREAIAIFELPPLDEGLYRVEVDAAVARPGGGRDAVAVLRRVRDLSVKSAAFPAVALFDELVESLAYIAEEKELAHIRSAPTPEERRRRFDAFWASIVPNRQAAASVMRLYYGRVEEANLFFSNAKEGWKTDRGMVYIVFGPPPIVEERIEVEIWRYSYRPDDVISTFVFERPPAVDRGSLFDTYILQRHPDYLRPWLRAQERWREGEVL